MPSRKIDLVFRTVGERTSDIALELAKKSLQPNNVFVLDSVRPFTKTVREMLKIQHNCDYVVHMDADCLILEDIRSFIEFTNLPYIDCFVSDRFRGDIHCGVHISRIDLIRKMQSTTHPVEELHYILNPESRVRHLALKELGLRKATKRFQILHDHLQWYSDIFSKYALRELRARRTTEKMESLELAMKGWKDEPDFTVARKAIEFTRHTIPKTSSNSVTSSFLDTLPSVATQQTQLLDLPPQEAMSPHELKSSISNFDTYLSRSPSTQIHQCTGGIRIKRPKVFGIGLSRTGTRTLTEALNVLGYEVVHYPADLVTFTELTRAQYHLSLLEFYDGITDITAAAFYKEFDRLFPDSKFILTERNVNAWLHSAKNHWDSSDAYKNNKSSMPSHYLSLRRFLRASTYGCLHFDVTQFSNVYHAHSKNVKQHFKDRKDSLCVVDVTGKNQWEQICGFLECDVPDQPFPHKGGALTKRITTSATDNSVVGRNSFVHERNCNGIRTH